MGSSSYDAIHHYQSNEYARSCVQGQHRHDSVNYSDYHSSNSSQDYNKSCSSYEDRRIEIHPSSPMSKACSTSESSSCSINLTTSDNHHQTRVIWHEIQPNNQFPLQNNINYNHNDFNKLIFDGNHQYAITSHNHHNDVMTSHGQQQQQQQFCSNYTEHFTYYSDNSANDNENNTVTYRCPEYRQHLNSVSAYNSYPTVEGQSEISAFEHGYATLQSLRQAEEANYQSSASLEVPVQRCLEQNLPYGLENNDNNMSIKRSDQLQATNNDYVASNADLMNHENNHSYNYNYHYNHEMNHGQDAHNLSNAADHPPTTTSYQDQTFKNPEPAQDGFHGQPVAIMGGSVPIQLQGGRFARDFDRQINNYAVFSSGFIDETNADHPAPSDDLQASYEPAERSRNGSPAKPTQFHGDKAQRNPMLQLKEKQKSNGDDTRVSKPYASKSSSSSLNCDTRACSTNNVAKINKCSICGRNYARPSTLKTHLRTHTHERPFKCQICQKTFSQAANLTAHQRVHTGERPFSCPICGRQFSQSSSVITHLRTHSGERPYRCNICNRTFSDSSTLTKHCRIHSGEKPYQCNYCSLNFSQSGNLSRHLKLHFVSTPLVAHNHNNNNNHNDNDGDNNDKGSKYVSFNDHDRYNIKTNGPTPHWDTTKLRTPNTVDDSARDIKYQLTQSEYNCAKLSTSPRSSSLSSSNSSYSSSSF